MRQLSVRISLLLFLLACLPFSHSHAFFSKQKIHENYLLSIFSKHFPIVGFDGCLSLPASKKKHQNPKINLTMSAGCPGVFNNIFSGLKPSHPRLTIASIEYPVINSFTTNNKHSGAIPGIYEISVTKRTLTILRQILTIEEAIHITCKAGKFVLCKKANDEGWLHASFPKTSQKYSNFHPEPPMLEITFNSCPSYNRCE